MEQRHGLGPAAIDARGFEPHRLEPPDEIADRAFLADRAGGAALELVGRERAYRLGEIGGVDARLRRRRRGDGGDGGEEKGGGKMRFHEAFRFGSGRGSSKAGS